MLRFRTIAPVLLVVAFAGGCAGAREESTSSRPFEGPTVEATTQPVDECHDASGDDGPVDIGDVTLYADKQEVTAAFDLTKPLPKTGTAMLGLYVSSADGSKTRQLGIKWANGKTTGAFISDAGSAKTDNLAADKVMQKGDQYVVANFRGTAVADLGKGWKWSAFANAAGNETDACPGPAGARKYQRFAGKTEKVPPGDGAWDLGNQG